MKQDEVVYTDGVIVSMRLHPTGGISFLFCFVTSLLTLRRDSRLFRIHGD